VVAEQLSNDVVDVDLNQPMAKIREKLSQYPIKTRVSLSGSLVVARDIAHAKLMVRRPCGPYSPHASPLHPHAAEHPGNHPPTATPPQPTTREVCITQERLQSGQGLPQYIKDMPVYYAGPAKTPDGMASGSFGPTTAGRMDSYVEPFQAAGGSMVMLAKGNRSGAVTRACQKHGAHSLSPALPNLLSIH
jgi:fumarate hydratase class I